MALAKRFLIAAIVLFVLVFIWLGIFPHEAPRVFLNQRRAVKSITDVNLAQRDYAAFHPDAGYACNLSDLAEQASEPSARVGFVDRVLASGTKSGYRFELQCLQDGNRKVTRFTITAVPQAAGTSGEYALCADQREEIWYSESGLASDCLALHKPIEKKYR